MARARRDLTRAPTLRARVAQDDEVGGHQIIEAAFVQGRERPRLDHLQRHAVPFAHSHDAFEETIYGIEGTVTFTIDGEAVDIGPGEAVCIRRGQVHSFVAGENDVSFLAIATPGAFGRAYFQDMAGVFAAAGGPPELEAIHTVMLRHGLTPAP